MHSGDPHVGPRSRALMPLIRVPMSPNPLRMRAAGVPPAARAPRSVWRLTPRGACAMLLACALPLLSGCASPRESGRTHTPLLGPEDPFAVKTSALLWPGAASALLVSDGPLSASAGSYALTWRASAGGEELPAGRFGREAERSPNVVWRAEGARARWRLELAPVTVRVGDETHLVASIELSVEGRSGARVPVEVVATLGPDSAFPVPASEHEPAPVRRWRRGAAGDPIALGPAEANLGELRLTGATARGRPLRWRFVLAASPRAAGALRKLARTSHASHVAVADREWVAMLAPAARFQIADSTLRQAVDEALLVLLGSSERTAGELRAIGNPFQYRDTWIRDAARQASALAQWGLHEPAREMVADLVRFQDEAGGFMSQPGQLDGSGQAMWAFEEVHGRAPRSGVPPALVEATLRAWRWCEGRRALVRERAPDFAGLMPPGDPRDNELAVGYLFGSDAWTIAGYRAGAALLARVGEPAAADSLRRAAADYQALLATRLVRERRVPASWSGPARDWGNLAAHFPTGAVSARTLADARLLPVIEHAGPGAGLAHYGTTDSLHLYLGADLAMDALLLGQPGPWQSTLASMLAARTGTGGHPELYCHSTRAFGWNLPPHATSAAALLTLVRQGLVFDAFGDTLRLTLGTLPAWWDEGVSLERAATRWGPLDVSFRREGERATWRWSPVPVPTLLRLPPGTRRVVEPGDGTPGGATWIVVPPGHDRAEVTCRVP